jgi:hypothetical protein
MGQKWGFYKFPLDPAHDQPAIGDELCWRAVEMPTPLITAEDVEYFRAGSPKVALGFDLARPLKTQLEEAKRFLVILQRRLQQNGQLHQYTVAGRREQWTLCLRALDGEASGASSTELATGIFPNDPSPESRLKRILFEAYALMQGKYREILSLPSS